MSALFGTLYFQTTDGEKRSLLASRIAGWIAAYENDQGQNETVRKRMARDIVG